MQHYLGTIRLQHVPVLHSAVCEHSVQFCACDHDRVEPMSPPGNTRLLLTIHEMYADAHTPRARFADMLR